jgi:FkbM family methyltransferase
MRKLVRKIRYMLENIYSNTPLLKWVYIKPIKKLYKKIVQWSTPEYTYADGFKIYLDKYDSVNINKNKFKNDREWEKLLSKNIKEGDTVLNIGANIGIYSLMMSKYVGSSGKVYAFEPSTDNITLLKKTIQANNLSDVIIPIKKAISNKNGRIKLFLSEFNLGNHHIFDTTGKRSYEEVAATTLDNFFNKNPEKISFILMDIEGSEFNALEGMERTIRNNKNLKIISEFSSPLLTEIGRSPLEFLEKIKNLEFNIYDIDKGGKITKIINLKNYAKTKSGKGGNIYLTKKKTNYGRKTNNLSQIFKKFKS